MESHNLNRSVAPAASANRRLYVWYGILLFIGVVVIFRLFYLQVIRHDHYRKAALSDQLREYSITPDRGIIEAHDASGVVPLVLNEKLYTLYGDPSFIKNPADDAKAIAGVTGGNVSDYEQLLKTPKTRYVILAKRLSEVQNTSIGKLKLPGVGTQAQNYRTYPQGSLAAQILGFVNNDGKGTYGIEQALDKQLGGTPGQLKAITDAAGVPLAANRDNIQINPKAGNDVVLTIDLGMQKQLEAILKDGLQKSKSKSGSAIIMDPNTGAIKAMANFPTYDPAHYFDEKDPSAFSNAAISDALEVGSIMKTLTLSTGLNEGVITPTTSYYDSGSVSVDGSTIKNVEGIPKNPTTIEDVFQYSLNTGAVYVLKQLGGGDINQKARTTWYDYMTNHFQLGKPTGIGLPNEGAGDVPDPLKGYGLNLQYANTVFGQGVTTTMLQMSAAVSSAINGGTYYRPYIIESQTAAGATVHQTKPTVVKKNVVSATTSQQMRDLLQYVFEHNHTGYASQLHEGYVIGGKTGTSQIPAPGGGYKENEYNGTFVGFVGGDRPQYVAVVLVNSPALPGYDTAGAQAAAPIFGNIENMLIDNFGVISKSN